MEFFHRDFKFSVPNEWWAAAGMKNFVPAARSYADMQDFFYRNAYEVRIEEVEPVRRRLSHGVFNNDLESGLSRLKTAPLEFLKVS
jgi:hypothetical protein